MLQRMHEKMAGIVTTIIISILCLAFALWGIQYYLTTHGDLNTMAKVNGKEITRTQLTAAYQRAREQVMTQKGKDFKFDQQTQDKLRASVLQNLIQSEAFFQEATKLGFKIGPSEINGILMQMPVFQVNGQFSQARFMQLLNQMLFSEQEFIQQLQENVIVNQLRLGVVNSSFVLPNEVDNIVKLLKQTRDINYAIISPAKYMHEVKITDQDINNYYQANKKEFTIPEKVSLQYLELSQEQLAKQIKPKLADLRQYYADNIDLYSQPKQWQITRILLPVSMSADRSTVNRAEKQANELYQKAKSGADFSKLDVTSSKPVWVSKQLPPEYLAKIQKLKPGQISAVFRTDQGFVIVKLLQIKEAKTPSFDEVRQQVDKGYIQAKAASLFNQASDQLSDLTYTNSNSLEPAAKALKLQIQTTDLFTSQGLKTGIAANSKVVSAAFSDAVLHQHYNSETIDFGGGKMVVVRINKYVPVTVKSLADVKIAIKAKLVAAAAQKEAQTVAKDILHKIDQGESAEKAVTSTGFAWNSVEKLTRDSKKLDSAIVDEAFNLPLPNGKKEDITYVDLTNGGIAIVAVNKVYEGENGQISSAELQQATKTLAANLGMNDFNLYSHKLINKAKIERFDKKNS